MPEDLTRHYTYRQSDPEGNLVDPSISKLEVDGEEVSDSNPLPVTLSGGGGASESIIVDELGNKTKVSEDGQLHVVLEGKLCTNNSTVELLGVDEVWTGEAVNILPYAGIALFVTSDAASATNGIEIQYSKDGINNWRTSEHYTLLAGAEKWFTPPSFGIYLRVKYTNGGVVQTSFEITTKLSKSPFKWSSHDIDMPISGNDDAELIKAVITGITPAGIFENANLSGFKNLNVAIAEIVSDAFGRQKVSLPTSLLDSVIEHDMDGTFVDYLTGGSATVVFDDVNNVVDMSVTNNGDYAVIETIANGKYQPGKALEFVASTLMTSEIGVIKRLGYCSVRFYTHTATNVIQNGIYFENNAGVLSWNIVKNGAVTETVIQDNWNTDKLNGSGASLFDLNTDYVQLPALDLQFLAVGTVRVGFNINGTDIFCHKFYHANTAPFDSTYMQTANLPVHYSIASIGGAGTMQAIGYSVASGGGFDALGKLNFIYDDDITISSGDTEMIVGMRLKDEFYNSFVEVISASVIATGSANFRWMLLLNPTYTGTVTWIDEPDSAIQVAKHNGNELITEGYKITAGLGSDRTRQGGSSVTNSLRLAKKLDGSFIEIWLAVYAITGDDFHGVINYKDLF